MRAVLTKTVDGEPRQFLDENFSPTTLLQDAAVIGVTIDNGKPKFTVLLAKFGISKLEELDDGWDLSPIDLRLV